MRTKDFIYYASAAVLLAVTTQVAQADEVATQTPSVTEGNQYQPATVQPRGRGGRYNFARTGLVPSCVP